MVMHFKSGGKIDINQLENLGNSIIETEAKNKTLLYVPGVLSLPMTISSNFTITKQDYTSAINVGYIEANESNAPFGGVAIDKNGRVISITSNQAYVGSEENQITFTNNAWTPSRSDDPQLEGFGNVNDEGYKRNSGNYNISITSGTDNFVYIKYIEVVKQTASSAQTVSGVNYETEFTDGYCIKVTTTEMTNNNDWIYLGKVDTDGNVDQSTMQRGYLNGSTVGAEYHAQTGWSSYPTLSGEYIDLETHVNALGTGIPSATNPHGLSAADIGANVNNAGFTSISTMTALNSSSYNIDSPLLNLTIAGAAEAYDVILVDASNAPEGSNVTIRLPEASINTTAYKYTIKSIGVSANSTVSISSIITTNTTNNYIEGGETMVSSDTTYSVLPLSGNTPITVVVGLAGGGYNWWRI